MKKGQSTDGMMPFLSVVIASVSGSPSIVECLGALMNQAGQISCEILVIDRCGEPTREEIRRRIPRPEIKVISIEGKPSIPRLRAIGIGKVKGRLVAILEDHCIVPPTWFETIARAYAAGHQVIGGPVENGAIDRIVDWAVYFCEYSRFMAPLPRGRTPEIAGNCAIYCRDVLERLGDKLQEEVWEGFLHQKLKEMGIEFYCDPDLVVCHKKEFGFGYFMSQRYHYSRSFASMRMKGVFWPGRLAYAFATPLLPPLLFARMVSSIWRKKRHLTKFALATPFILSFLISWAFGEAVGALFGPGRSLERVD
jgi:glycosyltransferase involved in cell wall biosynthesis